MMESRPDNDSAGTAPGALRWIEEFINTRRADRDDIATPEQLVAWLNDRDLVPRTVAATQQHRDRAECVREGLRALIAENNAEPVTSPRPDGLDPAARANLAVLARRLPLALDVSAQPPRLVPATHDPVDAALTSLLVHVVEAVAAGTWGRLKACREPSCRWAFFDHSRNQRRTWCSMDLCGNRAKARSFHRRVTAPD
ncbi:CGNR zinc finger domain-containing protein [Nonomuraea polychroma]|uniref:CGNR zinc finger domain-containing protein n=1 Tax=Nonomuraea polychroma TaxID=46176 RepID=UPI003D8D05F8